MVGKKSRALSPGVRHERRKESNRKAARKLRDRKLLEIAEKKRRYEQQKIENELMKEQIALLRKKRDAARFTLHEHMQHCGERGVSLGISMEEHRCQEELPQSPNSPDMEKNSCIGVGNQLTYFRFDKHEPTDEHSMCPNDVADHNQTSGPECKQEVQSEPEGEQKLCHTVGTLTPVAQPAQNYNIPIRTPPCTSSFPRQTITACTTIKTDDLALSCVQPEHSNIGSSSLEHSTSSSPTTTLKKELVGPPVASKMEEPFEDDFEHHSTEDLLGMVFPDIDSDPENGPQDWLDFYLMGLSEHDTLNTIYPVSESNI